MLVAVALLGCGGPPAARPASFAELAFETVAPPGWSRIRHEMTNHHSHFSLKIEDLAGARAEFLAGLPKSIEPELGRWTAHHFGEASLVATRDTTVGGLPARVVEFSAAPRPGKKPTDVRYWVVRRGDALYLFRAVFPPGRIEQDAAAVEAIVGGIRFVPPPGTSDPAWVAADSGDEPG
jgi:hypothetical protein